MVEIITLAFCLIIAIAEFIHWRRCQKLSSLAFGPEKHGYRWVILAPILRTVSLGLLLWGLMHLLLLPPRIVRPGKLVQEESHVVIVLDVSPSMKIQDAGNKKDQTRLKRAGDVVLSILRRLAVEHIKFSIIAVYNGARHVVTEAKDLNVIKNILQDLPMDQAFESGQTRLLQGIKEAALLTQKWRPDSTMLILISDGDMVPDVGMPVLPKAIKTTLVIGVGDRDGTFIGDHLSRQEISILHQIARRLKGSYQNANKKYVSSHLFDYFTKAKIFAKKRRWDLRQKALLSTFIGAFLLLLLGIYLDFWASNWKGNR